MTGSLRGLQIAAVMAALSGHPAFIAADQSSPAPRSTLVYAGADGKLQYRTDENGNRIAGTYTLHQVTETSPYSSTWNVADLTENATGNTTGFSTDCQYASCIQS